METERPIVKDMSLGDYIQISEKTEKEFDLRKIDTFSKIPLCFEVDDIFVSYGCSTDEHKPVPCGVMLAIKDGRRISSILLQGNDGRPDLSVYDTSFQLYSANRNRDLQNGLERFFTPWEHGFEHYSLRGTEEDFILNVCYEDSEKAVLSLKLQTAKDYYTAAAWFILVFAYRRGVLREDQAPVYDQYWPSRSVRSTDTLLKDIDSLLSDIQSKEKTIDCSDGEDVSKREQSNPLPFSHFQLVHSVGSYDESDNPRFFSDAGVVNVQYGDGILSFDLIGDSPKQNFNGIREFTFSPIISVYRGIGSQAHSHRYIGDSEGMNDEEELCQQAETVHAPYIKINPIVLECKALRIEESYSVNHVEASVFKTRLSDKIVEDGSVNLLKALSYMLWESDAEEPSETDETGS